MTTTLTTAWTSIFDVYHRHCHHMHFCQMQFFFNFNLNCCFDFLEKLNASRGRDIHLKLRNGIFDFSRPKRSRYEFRVKRFIFQTTNLSDTDCEYRSISQGDVMSLHLHHAETLAIEGINSCRNHTLNVELIAPMPEFFTNDSQRPSGNI